MNLGVPDIPKSNTPIDSTHSNNHGETAPISIPQEESDTSLSDSAGEQSFPTTGRRTHRPLPAFKRP